MQEKAYYLGCPMWANREWAGTLFTAKSNPNGFLGQYARVLSAVEGNTSFYGLPKSETVAKWRGATPKNFHFCFKFPQVISHAKGLRDADADVAQFFERLVPLGPRLGPFFLQLPPSFNDLEVLETFLRNLPRDFHYAVEVRHEDFYDESDFERTFTELLTELSIDRVVFDTRNLRSFKSDDEEIRQARKRKPQSPVRFEATGPRPFLRYVGHPALKPDLGLLGEWADRVAAWIEAGKTPYIFMHQVPEDLRAPELCRMFHKLLCRRLPQLEAMAPWPGENNPPDSTIDSGPVQLSLF